MKDLPETDDSVAQWCKDAFVVKVIIFLMHLLFRLMLAIDTYFVKFQSSSYDPNVSLNFLYYTYTFWSCLTHAVYFHTFFLYSFLSAYEEAFHATFFYSSVIMKFTLAKFPNFSIIYHSEVLVHYCIACLEYRILIYDDT